MFVALGGTSYAAIKLPANSVGTKQLKKGAVTKPKLGRGLAATLEGKPGTRGPIGAPGPTGQRGADGGDGSPGAPGSALAYAHVNSNFTLDAARSKNVVSISHQQACIPGGSTCIFFPAVCFKLSVPVKNAVVTADLADQGTTSDTNPPVARVRIPADPTGCGPNAAQPNRNDPDVQVTMTDKNGAFAQFGFYVLFN